MMSAHLADRVQPASFQALLPLLQGTCLVLIETARFAASSLLIVLGLPLALFLLVTGWDLAALFTQIGNLSDRYLEADSLRRSLFGQDIRACFLITVGAVTLLRLPRFLRRLAGELGNQEDREMRP